MKLVQLRQVSIEWDFINISKLRSEHDIREEGNYFCLLTLRQVEGDYEIDMCHVCVCMCHIFY